MSISNPAVENLNFKDPTSGDKKKGETIVNTPMQIEGNLNEERSFANVTQKLPTIKY